MVHHICLIGNSHLAGMRRAWPTIKEQFSQFQVTFFGGPGKTIADVELSDGLLSATTPRAAHLLNKVSGRTEIVLGDYNAFCVVGSGLRPSAAVDLIGEFSTRRSSGRRLISPEVFAAAVEGTLDHSVAMRLARLVRGVSQAPLFLIPQPWPMAGILDEKNDERLASAAQRCGAALGEASTVAAGFSQAMYGLAKLIDGATLPQPEFTIEREILTANRFRYFQDGERKDYAHANEEFGAATLKTVFSALTQTPVGR